MGPATFSSPTCQVCKTMTQHFRKEPQEPACHILWDPGCGHSQQVGLLHLEVRLGSLSCQRPLRRQGLPFESSPASKTIAGGERPRGDYTEALYSWYRSLKQPPCRSLFSLHRLPSPYTAPLEQEPPTRPFYASTAALKTAAGCWRYPFKRAKGSLSRALVRKSN